MNKGLMCGICLAVGAVIGYIWGKRVKNGEDLDAAVERTKKEIEQVRQSLPDIIPSPDLSKAIDDLKNSMNDMLKITRGEVPSMPALEEWRNRYRGQTRQT